MEANNKFIKFLDDIKTSKTEVFIESVKKGFNLCFESYPTQRDIDTPDDSDTATVNVPVLTEVGEDNPVEVIEKKEALLGEKKEVLEKTEDIKAEEAKLDMEQSEITGEQAEQEEDVAEVRSEL